MEESLESIQKEASAENNLQINCLEYVKQNRDCVIDETSIGEDLLNDEIITITEFAPKLFRKIRQSYLKESMLYQSLLPS